MKSAARQLAVERPCLQHHLQLFLKWFCITNRALASAISACNYLAKLSAISSKFREAVGKIPAGVVTRWNSDFVHSSSFGASVTVSMAAQTDLLNSYGYKVLQDMVTLLKPLMQITIDEEGELYITASAVIPRLLYAKKYTDNVFDMANGGSRPAEFSQLLMPELVKEWRPCFDELWAKYIKKFIDDPLLKVASLVDIRYVTSFNASQLRESSECLLNFTREQRARRSVQSTTPAANAGAQLASRRAAALDDS